MKNLKINPVNLNIFMTVIIFLFAGFMIGGFYYAQDWLKKAAIESNASIPKSTTTTNGTSDTNLLQTDISNQKDASEKSVAITTSGSDYQNSIKQDLDVYASNAGVIINDYGITQPPTNIKSTPLINGVQSNYVKVTLENPVSYRNLIKFIKAIETNIPKMKLTGISLGRANGSGDSVKVEPIIIELYTR